MNGDTLLHAATIHRSFLAHTGVSPIRADQDLILPTAPQVFAHTLWLLGEVPVLIEQNEIEKAMRWICFTQGTLWDRGLITTRVLRDLMRSVGLANDPRV